MKNPSNQPEQTVEQRLQNLERLTEWTQAPLKKAALEAGYRLEPIEPEQQILEPMESKENVKSSEQVVNMTFRLPRSRWKTLADLSTSERTSIQAILLAALEADFKRRNLPF